ncbi:MAG: cytochrome c oxidase cbb3-type subunit III [bacterium]|nr:MAG: cytochrome c oxidase cbb3-type subunit III [bacterium]
MRKYWKLLPVILVIFTCVAAYINNVGSTQTDEMEIDTIYIKRCAGCHGTDGVPTIDGVPDFTDAKFQSSHTDEEFIKSITNGKEPRMPAYSEILEKEQITALVPYIRKLAQKEEKKK